MQTPLSWLPSPPDTLFGTIFFSQDGNSVILPVPFYAMGAKGVAAGPSMFTLHYYNTTTGNHEKTKDVDPTSYPRTWQFVRGRKIQHSVSDDIAIAQLTAHGELKIEGKERYKGQKFMIKVYDQRGKPDVAIHKEYLASLYQLGPQNYRAVIWHLNDMLNVDNWFKTGWLNANIDKDQLLSLMSTLYSSIANNRKAPLSQDDLKTFQKIPYFVRKYLDNRVITFSIFGN